MGRFGDDPRAFFTSIYADVAPWDIGGPQPALMDLLAAHQPESPVLDLGCGSGDLAIALAEQGATVLGVDFAEPAIEQARAKAESLPQAVRGRLEFLVGDALRPSRLGRSFRSAVDSGFLHLFEPAEAERMIDDLATALEPGGRFYLLEFAVEFPIPNTPRAVSEGELRQWLSVENGWRLLELRPAQFESRIAPVPAVAACAERIAAS